MKKQELENRLRNFETLVYSNETDVFEFMYSKIYKIHFNQDVFKVMRNGKFRPKKYTVSEIMQIIKLHKLQLEEL